MSSGLWGLLPDWAIKEMVLEAQVIEPFVDESPLGVISYGLSSYGYDIRLHTTFKTPQRRIGVPIIIDPKSPIEYAEHVSQDVVLLPPNDFVLARSLEYIRVPRDILVLCVGKSTLARMGVIVNVTPLEPEWEGYITLEISNTTPYHTKLYVGEGVAQLLFFRALEDCRVSYADKKGKYQKQQTILPPIV